MKKVLNEKTPNKIFPVKINRIVQFLTYSDILVLSSWGLVTPFLTVFMSDNIKDGSVAVAGFATTLYLITMSILQIPIAKFLDDHKGEIDDYKIMLIGSSIVSLSALLFVLASNSVHIYAIQILNGFGVSLTYPSWNAIFSRHLDKNQEAFEWSYYNTAIGVGTAITASLGGLLIDKFGYDVVFFIVATFSLGGAVMLLGIKKDLKKA